MPWPFKAGVIKVTVTYGFEGKPSVNVHFVLQDTPTSPITDAELLLAADAAEAAWQFFWDLTANAGWGVDQITALDYSREGGNAVDASGTYPHPGEVAGNAYSSNVACVVSQRTARTGRSYRGRNFVPGLSVSKAIDNTVEAAYAVSLNTLYSEFRDELALVNMRHVVYSLYNGGAERVTPETTAITGTITNTRVDTQRRRLPT